MTQTMRSLAQLETLLANNTSGAISPTDVRDALIATIQPGYAQMYISSSAATTLGDTSTWVQVGGTWTLADNSANWSMGVNGQLLYGGAQDREVHIWVAFSMTSVGNNKQTQWGVAVDGAIQTPSIIQRYVSTGADIGAAAVLAHVDISNGEYLSFVCRNITSADNLTATLANFAVLDVAL